MKTQGNWSGGTLTGESVSIGVRVSEAICASARVAGTPLEPMITSTLSSVTSLRPFFAALLASPALSRMMNLTGSPPRVFGIRSKAFL